MLRDCKQLQLQKDWEIVCAFDVRSSAKEQVKSLGAKFIEVNSEEKIDSVYAKEMSADYQKTKRITD